MHSGSISYSPDYKSEKPLNQRVKIRPSGQPSVDAADLVESRLKRIEGTEASAERARLEREVIDLAKKWRADMTHKTDVALVRAVDKLNSFEAEQEKKS